MSIYIPSSRFVIKAKTPMGVERWVRRVGFKRFSPTDDFSKAIILEKDECNFWALHLGQWFTSFKFSIVWFDDAEASLNKDEGKTDGE